MDLKLAIHELNISVQTGKHVEIDDAAFEGIAIRASIDGVIPDAWLQSGAAFAEKLPDISFGPGGSENPIQDVDSAKAALFDALAFLYKVGLTRDAMEALVNGALDACVEAEKR